MFIREAMQSFSMALGSTRRNPGVTSVYNLDRVSDHLPGVSLSQIQEIKYNGWCEIQICFYFNAVKMSNGYCLPCGRIVWVS